MQTDLSAAHRRQIRQLLADLSAENQSHRETWHGSTPSHGRMPEPAKLLQRAAPAKLASGGRGSPKILVQFLSALKIGGERRLMGTQREEAGVTSDRESDMRACVDQSVS